MTLTDPTVLGTWLAGTQLVFGLVCLVAGLRSRGGQGQLLAPLGAMFVIMGSFRFRTDAAPDDILIPLWILAFAAAALWLLRGIRASRTRTQEFLRQRGNSQS